MKRIISLCCVCLTLLTALAVPVKATEIANDANWIEVLDYATVNDSGENGFSFTGSTQISLGLPSSFPLGYIEIIFYSNRTISSVSCGQGPGQRPMTISKISQTYYRAYVNMGGSSRSWTTYFNFISADSNNVTRVTLLSCKFATLDVVPWDIPAQCEIVSAEFQDTINYSPSDDVNYRIFQSASNYDDLFLMCYITVDTWKNYDYIDFQLMFDCFSIDSISASIGSINLPLDVSDYSSSNLGNSTHLISMRLDLSGIQRTTTDYPMITIMGTLDFDTSNSIDFVNCSGYILTSSFEPDVTWLSRIYSLIDLELWGWINTQTTYLTQEIQDAVTSISMEFTNLKANIDLSFENLVRSLDDWHTSLDTHLETMTTRIVEAITGDTVHGENFQEELQYREDDLDDMADVMDSVEMPDIDSIDVDIDSFVDPADVEVLAAPLTVFLEADLFRTMIIMSILLATVSYTLYGKR